MIHAQEPAAGRATIKVEAAADGGSVSIEDPSPLEVVALAIAMGAAVFTAYLFVRLRLQKAEDQERRGGF